MKTDALTIASILGAITANQEQIEWWLRTTGALIAIAAGLVALYQRLRKKPRKDLD